MKTTQEDPEALPFILDDVVDIDLSPPGKRIVHDLPTLEDEDAIAKRLRKPVVNDDEESLKHRHSRKRLSGLVHSFIRKENFFLNTADGKLPLEISS